MQEESEEEEEQEESDIDDALADLDIPAQDGVIGPVPLTKQQRATAERVLRDGNDTEVCLVKSGCTAGCLTCSACASTCICRMTQLNIRPSAAAYCPHYRKIFSDNDGLLPCNCLSAHPVADQMQHSVLPAVLGPAGCMCMSAMRVSQAGRSMGNEKHVADAAGCM